VPLGRLLLRKSRPTFSFWVRPSCGTNFPTALASGLLLNAREVIGDVMLTKNLPAANRVETDLAGLALAPEYLGSVGVVLILILPFSAVLWLCHSEG